ncbi:FkbM family methyltransferase [Rhodothermus sp. AH-315-K08]|nr:FkbM family methyltransferase [Rhodothermus sp. AH-315-K08]
MSLLSHLGHKYPFLNGYGRLANSPALRGVIDFQAAAEVRAVLRNRMMILGHRGDFVTRAALVFGDLDPKVTLLARRLLREGDTVIDVGANIGVFSLFASEFVGSSGVVHAFEPQPDLIAMFNRSLQLNGVTNVEVHPAALGEENGRRVMCVPSGNCGAASLAWRVDGAREVEVDVLRMDDFMKKENVGPARLMKIDVEGFESGVIAGASKLLESGSPDAIIVEVQHSWTGGTKSVLEQLEDYGYRWWEIWPSAFQLRLGGPGIRSEKKGVHDVLAVLPGVVGQDIMSWLDFKVVP